MGLESATYVSDLVSSNPTGTDLESQGDDHLRLIKSSLQTTFTNAGRIFRFMDTKSSRTTTYSVSETADLHKMIPCDATSAGFTVGLPSTTIDGWWCVISKRDSTTNAITIDPSGAGTINGASTITLTTQYDSMIVWWDNQASVWIGMRLFPSVPYYSGAQNIPFSDIAPSSNAKRILAATTATDFSEHTMAAALEFISASMARGDILVRGASSFDRLAIGASGTFLKSDGTDPSWSSTFLQPAFSSTTYATNTTIAGTIPYDDSIPQVGEGTEVLSTSITAIKSSSKIKITFQAFGGVASSGPATAALFIDGAADAVQASIMQTAVVNTAYPIALEYIYTPGNTSAHTISIRFGSNSGNSFLNGNGIASRRYGGAAAATLVCQEIFTA